MWYTENANSYISDRIPTESFIFVYKIGRNRLRKAGVYVKILSILAQDCE